MIKLCEGLGGTKTTINLSSKMSHVSLNDNQLKKSGISK